MRWLPGGRAQALATLHRRKRVADAINHFHRTDPARAEEAARRVAAHARELERAGVPAEARIFRAGGWRLAGLLVRDGVGLWFGSLLGLIGLLHHAVPYGVVRLVAGRLEGSGRMVVALSRLGLSLPVYAAWYAFVWWRMSLYFLPWVAWAWALAMPWAGLTALAWSRRWRRVGRFWWAEVRLLLDRPRAARLRREDEEVGALLDRFAGEAGLPTTVTAPVSAGKVYRTPWWMTAAVAAGVLALLGGTGAWLLRDRPIEFLRHSGPALHRLAEARLDERMEADEKGLLAVIRGLAELEAKIRTFEGKLLAGERS